jgi:hypothetical protein
VLAFSTQVRGFKPGRSRRIFQGEKKILSTTSFGGEVKPSVACRRFAACKRSLNVAWKSGISGKIHWPFLAHIVPPLAARSYGRRLVVRVGTSKGSTISLWLQHIRGISYRGPTERKKEEKTTYVNYWVVN